MFAFVRWIGNIIATLGDIKAYVKEIRDNFNRLMFALIEPGPLKATITRIVQEGDMKRVFHNYQFPPKGPNDGDVVKQTVNVYNNDSDELIETKDFDGAATESGEMAVGILEETNVRAEFERVDDAGLKSPPGEPLIFNVDVTPPDAPGALSATIARIEDVVEDGGDEEE